MPDSEKGFSSVLVILVLGIVGSSVVTSFIPVNRQYNDGKSNVAGVYTSEKVQKPDFKIASDSGQTAIVEKSVGALSAFPLSVNKTTNELTVTTPAGTKVVTILPEQAVNSML